MVGVGSNDCLEPPIIFKAFAKSVEYIVFASTVVVKKCMYTQLEILKKEVLI